MKKIKYTLCENDVILDWNETNEEIAKTEADNPDQVEIFDDGQPEPEAKPTDAERITELEEALAMLLNEVTE